MFPSVRSQMLPSWLLLLHLAFSIIAWSLGCSRSCTDCTTVQIRCIVLGCVCVTASTGDPCCTLRTSEASSEQLPVSFRRVWLVRFLPAVFLDSAHVSVRYIGDNIWLTRQITPRMSCAAACSLAGGHSIRDYSLHSRFWGTCAPRCDCKPPKYQTQPSLAADAITQMSSLCLKHPNILCAFFRTIQCNVNEEPL